MKNTKKSIMLFSFLLLIGMLGFLFQPVSLIAFEGGWNYGNNSYSNPYYYNSWGSYPVNNNYLGYNSYYPNFNSNYRISNNFGYYSNNNYVGNMNYRTSSYSSNFNRNYNYNQNYGRNYNYPIGYGFNCIGYSC